MSDSCEVVTIETENGPVDINKSDFDKAKHKLYKKEKPKEQAEDKPEKASKKSTKKSK
jgi:hypothetical protein